MKNKKFQDNSGMTYTSQKRHSLQNNITVPYKIQWPNPSKDQGKPGHNKNFFQNMKNELTSIKNDFEKLIKKETTFTSQDKRPNRQDAFYSTGMPKGKSFTSSKRQTKKMYFEDNDKQDAFFNLQDLETKYKRMNNASKVNSFTEKKTAPLIEEQIIRKEHIFKPKIQEELQINKPIEEKKVIEHVKLESDEKSSKQIEKLTKDKSDLERNNNQLKGKLQHMSFSLSKINHENINLQKQKQYFERQVTRLNQQQKAFRQKMEELSQQLRNKLQYLRKQQQQTFRNQQQIQYLKKELKEREHKIQVLENHLNKKEQIIFTNQHKIQELGSELAQKQYQIQQLGSELSQLKNQPPSNQNQLQQQLHNQRTFYEERINQLIFHNDNFHKINFELGRENEQLKNQINEMHNFIEHTTKTAQNNQQNLQRKIQYMKNDLQQYDKRQNMFAQQIESLGKQLRQEMQAKTQLEKKISLISNVDEADEQSNISNLLSEIHSLTEQLALQRNINTTLTQKYEEQLKKINVQSIATSLEKSMNSMAEQNAFLKSKVNSLQADLQSLIQQNNSFKKQIQLYEERQKWNQVNKKMSSSQWEQLTEQIQKLTEENRLLREDLQFKIIKEEVRNSPSKQFQVDYEQNLAKIAHEQLEEIQNLKEQIKSLRDETQFLRSELQNQQKICIQLKNICKGKKVDLSIIQEMQRKSNQISTLKNIIFKVLIQKVEKDESQPEFEYYITRLQELRSQFFSQ